MIRKREILISKPELRKKYLSKPHDRKRGLVARPDLSIDSHEPIKQLIAGLHGRELIVLLRKLANQIEAVHHFLAADRPSGHQLALPAQPTHLAHLADVGDGHGEEDGALGAARQGGVVDLHRLVGGEVQQRRGLRLVDNEHAALSAVAAVELHGARRKGDLALLAEYADAALGPLRAHSRFGPVHRQLALNAGRCRAPEEAEHPARESFLGRLRVDLLVLRRVSLRLRRRSDGRVDLFVCRVKVDVLVADVGGLVGSGVQGMGWGRGQRGAVGFADAEEGECELGIGGDALKEGAVAKMSVDEMMLSMVWREAYFCSSRSLSQRGNSRFRYATPRLMIGSPKNAKPTPKVLILTNMWLEMIRDARKPTDSTLANRRYGVIMEKGGVGDKALPIVNHGSP